MLGVCKKVCERKALDVIFVGEKALHRYFSGVTKNLNQITRHSELSQLCDWVLAADHAHADVIYVTELALYNTARALHADLLIDFTP